MERKSFEEGIILALVSPPIPHVVKKPIAYSYNGVILPKLPEWDRERYPYAVIIGIEHSDGSQGYSFRITDEPVICKKAGWVGNYYDAIVLSGTGCRYSYEETEWPQFGIMGEEMAATLPLDSYEIVWANHDVYYGEEIYLSASEPIPVYE